MDGLHCRKCQCESSSRLRPDRHGLDMRFYRAGEPDQKYQHEENLCITGHREDLRGVHM